VSGDRWVDEQADRSRRVGHVAVAVREAIADGRPLARDWPGAAGDVLSELEEILERGNHPDDVDRAQKAIMSLAGLWMTVEEAEQVFLGADDGGTR
jgi:hypothetical protein